MTEVLDIVQNIGKDVAVPENPESEGSRLITLKQIELEHGVSRSALHTYRRSSSFPQPVPVEGSTKTQYRADEVAAWFQANPKQQGKKRDQFVSHQQGDSMDARKDLYAFAMQGKEHSPAVSERASQKIDAFRASVLREAADRLDESEALRDLTDDHMHDVNAAANELRRMAEETTEASDG
ncbi:AlpA family phage regulatory protein [Streptomyces bobili]|uniref:helix-turn-helix transcriptional regulator n=1 Tax=Streptomyces bobili TaxID=67280 RepID=UPI00340C116C